MRGADVDDVAGVDDRPGDRDVEGDKLSGLFRRTRHSHPDIADIFAVGDDVIIGEYVTVERRNPSR
jgi:hypothetical protein